MTARRLNHAEWRSQELLERLSNQDRVFGENYRALLRNSPTRVLRIRTDKGDRPQFEVIKDWLVRQSLARKRREEAERVAYQARHERRIQATEEELFR